MNRPTPHGDKLRALIKNPKLPAGDRPHVRSAIRRYHAWVAELESIEGTGDSLLAPMVASLARYKTSIDLDLVFDSEDDFLYRQKGQLKLDNTVLEEFIPWLVGRVLADLIAGRGLTMGLANCFAQLRFDSDLPRGKVGGGMGVRSKDHDFVMARPLFLKASHDRGFKDSLLEQTHLAYVAAEIKTNLDKTMFQEAVATANDPSSPWTNPPGIRPAMHPGWAASLNNSRCKNNITFSQVQYTVYLSKAPLCVAPWANSPAVPLSSRLASPAPHRSRCSRGLIHGQLGRPFRIPGISCFASGWT